MSLTYPNDTITTRPLDASINEAADTEVFVPRYARTGKARAGQKKVKTWMILAPLGGLVLIGGAAMMLMNDGEATAPLAEPAAAIAAPTMAPMIAQPPVVAAPSTIAATPAPIAVAPQPVVRERQPVRETAAPVARRAASVERAASAPRIATPAEPTGPRSYDASPSVIAPAAGLAAPPPAITVRPLT